jgi:hypothetical protein
MSENKKGYRSIRGLGIMLEKNLKFTKESVVQIKEFLTRRGFTGDDVNWIDQYGQKQYVVLLQCIDIIKRTGRSVDMFLFEFCVKGHYLTTDAKIDSARWLMGKDIEKAVSSYANNDDALEILRDENEFTSSLNELIGVMKDKYSSKLPEVLIKEDVTRVFNSMSDYKTEESESSDDVEVLSEDDVEVIENGKRALLIPEGDQNSFRAQYSDFINKGLPMIIKYIESLALTEVETEEILNPIKSAIEQISQIDLDDTQMVQNELIDYIRSTFTKLSNSMSKNKFSGTYKTILNQIQGYANGKIKEGVIYNHSEFENVFELVTTLIPIVKAFLSNVYDSDMSDDETIETIQAFFVEVKELKTSISNDEFKQLYSIIVGNLEREMKLYIKTLTSDPKTEQPTQEKETKEPEPVVVTNGKSQHQLLRSQVKEIFGYVTLTPEESECILRLRDVKFYTGNALDNIIDNKNNKLFVVLRKIYKACSDSNKLINDIVELNFRERKGDRDWQYNHNAIVKLVQYVSA